MLFAPRPGRPTMQPLARRMQPLRPEPNYPDAAADRPSRPMYWQRARGLADRAEYDAAASEAAGLNEQSPAWQGDYEPRMAMARERAFRGVQSIRADDFDRRQKLYGMDLREQERQDRLVQDWARQALEGKKFGFEQERGRAELGLRGEELDMRREDLGLRREDQALDRDLRERQFGLSEKQFGGIEEERKADRAWREKQFGGIEEERKADRAWREKQFEAEQSDKEAVRKIGMAERFTPESVQAFEKSGEPTVQGFQDIGGMSVPNVVPGKENYGLLRKPEKDREGDYADVLDYIADALDYIGSHEELAGLPDRQKAPKKPGVLGRVRGGVSQIGGQLGESRREGGPNARPYQEGGLNARPARGLRGQETPDADEDAQAIEWAQANPDDPRAQGILRAHGYR